MFETFIISITYYTSGHLVGDNNLSLDKNTMWKQCRRGHEMLETFTMIDLNRYKFSVGMLSSSHHLEQFEGLIGIEK